MAKRIRKKNIVEFDQVSQRWIIEAMIMCDSKSDLPAIDEFENYLLAQGSLAIVIDTSDRYRITSDGTWNKNSSGGGSATLITKTITENGTYNASDDSADGYSTVSVDVQNTYTVEDEGKVVDNGSLVVQTAMSTEITANDTYDTTLYNSVTVNVPQGGGSSSSMKYVNFYDYDGTIVYSYTQAEFADLSAMPENPTHEGLTAQGWNWTLADARAYVASYGKINIGQMYITSDGKTRLYFTVAKDNLSVELHLDLASDTELDIDWGDGSTHTTWTSIDGDDSKSHEYASAGRCVIAITVITGEFSLSQAISNIYKVEIGNGAVDIGYNAFENCYALSSITIPDGVTSIGENAFSYCRSLSSITIPDGVTSIGQFAFNCCSSVSSITIPNGVTSIGSNTFNSCSSLSSITIPDSVTIINNYTFYGCSSLSSITIPNSVTDIGENAFHDCYALSSITIPDGVMYIEGSAFENCYALSSITISDGVTSIGSTVFYECYALLSITFPNGVTNIGSSVFYDCYALSSITFESSNPPDLDSYIDIPNTCIIRVPQGSLSAYTSANNYPDPSAYIYEEY